MTDGITITHSALSSRSCGISSGMLRMSRMTCPEFCSRCWLLLSDLSAVLAFDAKAAFAQANEIAQKTAIAFRIRIPPEVVNILVISLGVHKQVGAAWLPVCCETGIQVATRVCAKWHIIARCLELNLRWEIRCSRAFLQSPSAP